MVPRRRPVDLGNPLRMSLELGNSEAGAAYFLGDAEGNVFLNHAAVEGLFSEALTSFTDARPH